MSLLAGLAIWLLDVILVAALSRDGKRARISLGAAALFLPIPLFVAAPPIQRGLLTFAFEICFIRAVQFALKPPGRAFGARLVDILLFVTFIDTRTAARVERRFSVRSAATILVACGIAMTAALVWRAAVGSPWWLRYSVRVVAGAVLIFAAVEIATAVVRLSTTLVGVAVPPLHDAPYRAMSLGEFWGRRWNTGAATALRELCFGRIARRSGALAVVATFALSAALHMYIGFVALGLAPALMWAAFFFIQPLLIALERKLRIKRWSPLARQVWTMSVLALTSPLLLAPFLRFFDIRL